MAKNLHLVLQAKGGVGKSAFTYMVASKHKFDNKEALFFDLDDETKTTANQLSFANAQYIDLIDKSTKQIDRTSFDELLVSFSEQEYSDYWLDFGGSTSQQFLMYLKDEGTSDLLQMFEELELKLHIYCVVGGNNTFDASLEYCKKLMDTIGNNANRIIVKNNLFNYDNGQEELINSIGKSKNNKTIAFGLLGNLKGSALEKVKTHMSKGEYILDAGDKALQMRFKAILKNFKYE